MTKFFILFILTHFTLSIYGQTDIKKISLKDAIKIGLKNNPEIMIAKENIGASKGRFWSGISLPQPEIGVSYEYVPVNNSLNNFSEKTIEFKQSFEFPTNYFLKGSKLNKEEDIIQNKFRLIERKVINLIKSCYFKVMVKKYQQKSAEENLKISEDFLKKSEIKLSVGEGTNLEKLTAKVQFAESVNMFEISKNELITSIAELNNVLGFGKENINYDLTDSLYFIEYEIDFEKIINTYEEENPQVKIAQLNLGISTIEKNLAWSSLLPNFNLAYFKQTRDGDGGLYGASFGISVPLWFLFEQKGKIQEATANQSISESEIQATKNELYLKLKSSFTEYGNNLKQVKLYISDILLQSEEIYRIANKSYAVGELTYLEYLLAKQTLLNAQKNYINALFSYYQSVFQIEEITGKDFTEKKEMEK